MYFYIFLYDKSNFSTIKMSMERWPSGLRRTPGKCVEMKVSRGFESLSLRHVPNYVKSYYVINLGWVSILLTKALQAISL